VDPQVTPELQEIIYRALEREPVNRYKTAGEFARDLEHPEEVVVAERTELTDWKERRSPLVRQIAFYVMLVLIPIVVFGLLIYVAKHT
jgi:eukaryotic-like serine/threonine-protein kinase